MQQSLFIADGVGGINIASVDTTTPGAAEAGLVVRPIDPAEGSTGTAIPTTAILIGASDGINLQQLLVESASNRNLRVGLFNGSLEASITATGSSAGNALQTLVGQYNSTFPTLTNGQTSFIQVDTSGRNIIAPLTNASIVKAQLQDNVGNGILSTSGRLQTYDAGGAEFLENWMLPATGTGNAPDPTKWIVEQSSGAVSNFGSVVAGYGGVISITTTSGSKYVFNTNPVVSQKIFMGAHPKTLDITLGLEIFSATSNYTHYWGLGFFSTTFCTTVAGNWSVFGIGFEDNGGVLQAVIYSAVAVKTVIGTLTRPNDGAPHKYRIVFSYDRIEYYIDDMSTTVAVASAATIRTIGIGGWGFTIQIGLGNNVGTNTTGGGLNIGTISVTSNSTNSLVLADSTYGWRKSTIDSTGSLQVLDAGTYLNRGGADRMRIGVDSILLDDSFEQASLNTQIWTSSVSGMTQAISNNALSMNSGNVITSGTYSIVTSNRKIRIYGHYGVEALFRGSLSTTGGKVVEFGLGLVATTAAPTDGVFFRFPSGTLVATPVINYNGVETVSSTTFTVLSTFEYSYYITKKIDRIHFKIVDFTGTSVLDVDLTIPSNNQLFTLNTHLPVFLREYQASVGSVASSSNFGLISICQMDIAGNRDWATQMASTIRGAILKPDTFSQAPNYPLSAAPGNSALATGTPSLTTLGGIAAITMVAGAETDYPVCSFQVPSNYTLFITAVKIDGIVTTAIGVTAGTFCWGLGVNGTANVLTSGSPIRVPIGTQGVLAAAPVGTAISNSIDHNFSTPLVIESGRFLHTILRVVTGVATGVIRFNIMFEGYFE